MLRRNTGPTRRRLIGGSFALVVTTLVGSFVGASLDAQAEDGRVRPRRDLPDDVAFAVFYTDLRNAVAARDAERLRALFAEDAVLEDALGAPGDEPLWQALDEILALGGAMRGDVFVAPSLALDLPPREAPEDRAVGIGDAVAHEEPSARSPVVAGVGGRVMRVDGAAEATAGWTAVTLDEARVYVQNRDLWRADGPRLEATDTAAGWRVTRLARAA